MHLLNACLTQVFPTLFNLLRWLTVSIGFCATLFLFHERALADQTVQGKARYAQSQELLELKQDLGKIDQDAADGLYDGASAIVGRSIKARVLYRNYIKQASIISEELLSLRPRLSENSHTLTLQQLGAFTQNLTAEKQRFISSFQHGEEQFQTSRLIQTAVRNLEEALSYWRIANRYRALYRASEQEHTADDQILRLKLQAALNAIDQLKAIIHTRDALSKDLAEE